MPSEPRSVNCLVLVAAVALAVTVGVWQLHLGDVLVYRAGGRALFGGDLYGLRVGGFGFTYPPFAALLFATLSWLAPTLMFAALTAASAVSALVVLRCSMPASRRPTVSAALRVAPLVSAQPLIATVAWGQVNLVLAAVVLYDLLVRRSGVLVGLAAAVKLTPAIFVLYLLLTGRRREAGRAAIAFAATVALGAVVAPSASLQYWTHDAVAGTGVGGFDHTANQSVRGLAERILGVDAGITVWLLLAGPVLVLGLLLARRAGRDGQELLAVGIVGITACLVSPVSWTHHWVWCIPCLAALAVPARLVLGAVFVNPVSLGHVLGFGYPLAGAAILGLVAVDQRSTGRGCPRLPVEEVSQRRGSPVRWSIVSHRSWTARSIRTKSSAVYRRTFRGSAATNGNPATDTASV